MLARAAAAPAQDGDWAPPFDIPAIGIHAAMLPTGKVLWFYRNSTDVRVGRATLWDPATGTFKSVPPPLINGRPANVFCAGQSFLADGRLLVMGGQLGPDPVAAEGEEFRGLNAVFTFNPFDETWTRQPDMADGRWYPTQVLTPDGRTIVMSGYDSSGVPNAPHNSDIEVFTPSADLNGVGTVTRIGRRGGPNQPSTGGLYPHLFTMPSGRTLVAGPRSTDSWFLHPLGSPPTLAWSDVPDPASHSYGSGVILPSATPGAASTKVALIAGGNVAGTRNQVFDEAAPATGWVDAPPLNVPRSHHNTVLLPDGSMVTVGGGKGSVNGGDKSQVIPDNLSVELYDPASGTWRQGPFQREARAYHSTALLLPDGRVVSAGDDTAGGSRVDTAEIYSPPYLFKGARPAITSAPAAVGYGQAFAAGYSGSDVRQAVLVAPGATTHANDMAQRYVPLQVTANAAGSVTLTSPANANVAPPGYYMLFLVNAQGVPSVARFVRIDPGAPAPVPDPPAPTATPEDATPDTPLAQEVPAGGQTAPGTTTVPGTPAQGTTPAPAPAPAPARPGTSGSSTPAPSTEGLLEGLLRNPSLARQTLRQVKTRGLQLGVSCTQACTVRAELRLDRRVALRLGLTRRRRGSSTVLVGRSTLAVRRGQTGRLAVRFAAAAKRRLPRTGALVVRVRLAASAAGGTTDALTRRTTLR